MKGAGDENWRNRVDSVVLLSKEDVWLYRFSKLQRTWTDEQAKKLLEAMKALGSRHGGIARMQFGSGWVYVTEGDHLWVFMGIVGKPLRPDEVEPMKSAVRGAVMELERKYQEHLTAGDAREALPGLGTELFRMLGLQPASYFDSTKEIRKWRDLNWQS